VLHLLEIASLAAFILYANKYLRDMARVCVKEFPVYIAIAKYVPGEEDGLALEEGDVVEILDSRNPDRWLCRMLDRPDNQGWVPPSYLVAKSQEKLDTRSTQEVFREDIIKISNKQQEAVMKRRYVVNPRAQAGQTGVSK